MVSYLPSSLSSCTYSRHEPANIPMEGLFCDRIILRGGSGLKERGNISVIKLH